MDNPLLNHLVVTKILNFGQLQFEQLKEFRLVCKLWYTLSLSQWRQSVTLRLAEDDPNNNANVLNGVSIETLSRLLTTQSFDSNLLELCKKPYVNYKLPGWSSGYPKNKSDLENNWKNHIAPGILKLAIDSCYFPDSKCLEDKLFACANLKELVLIGNSSGICRGYKIPQSFSEEAPRLENLKVLVVDGGMPLQWSKLLLHTPNLEDLTIKQNGSYFRTTFASFLLDLHQLEYSGRNPMDIKHLDILEADDTFTDFVSLSSRNLRLESLSLRFEKTRPEHFLQPLLQAQARTLKTLKILRVSDRLEEPFGQFEFPYGVLLQNLEELYLWGNIVKSLEFLRFTPNLKKLWISRDRYEMRHLLKEGGLESLEGIAEDLVEGGGGDEGFDMKSMQVLQMDCKCSQESLKILRKWMPNLEGFGGILDNERLQWVCEQWPKLKEIKVLHGSDVSDDEVSSVSKLTKIAVIREIR